MNQTVGRFQEIRKIPLVEDRVKIQLIKGWINSESLCRIINGDAILHLHSEHVSLTDVIFYEFERQCSAADKVMIRDIKGVARNKYEHEQSIN